MDSISNSPTGLTKDAGWQIGLRRTLTIPAPVLWDWMLSPEGVETWLGPAEIFRMETGEKYRLVDGTVGQIRIYQRGSHLRITRHPPGSVYPRASVMQIRILDSGEKSTLAFHEEHLPTRNERNIRKEFYLQVVVKIKEYLLAG